MLSDYELEAFESGKSDWVEIRKPDASKNGQLSPKAKMPTPKALYAAVAAKAPRLSPRQPVAPTIVSTSSTKNTRKRQKNAKRRSHRNHLRDLEISQAQRLGHTNV